MTLAVITDQVESQGAKMGRVLVEEGDRCGGDSQVSALRHQRNHKDLRNIAFLVKVIKYKTTKCA